MGKLIKKKITFLIDQLRYNITGLIQNLCLTTRNLYRINSIICDITSRRLLLRSAATLFLFFHIRHRFVTRPIKKPIAKLANRINTNHPPER